MDETASNGSANGGSAAEEPDWDDTQARALIGKRVLISTTTEDNSGAFVARWQAYGTVSRADRQEGMIAVALEGLNTGDETSLPPITSAFVPADPGIYSLPDSGEEVENPDYTVRWTVKLPEDT